MTIAPAPLQALLQQGLQLHQNGRLEEADRLYRRLQAQSPRLFDAWHLSGVVALQRGRPSDALELLRRALALEPKNAVCTMRFALALALAGKHTEAVKYFQSALRLDPKAAETWANLASSLRALGQTQEAIQAYQQAIRLKPDYAEAIDLAGALIADTQGLTAALPYFQKATSLAPKNAAAWCNLGLALAHHSQFTAALAALDRSHELDPKVAKPLVAKALIFQQTYRLSEAAAAYQAALRLEPANAEAHSGLLLTLHYLSGVSKAQLHAAHLAFGRSLPAPTKSAPSLPREPGAPLRVGFLSPDLRRHSVAYFLEPLLRHCDPARITLCLYHDHATVDSFSAELKSLAAVWRNFAGLPHDVVERQLRQDRLDVLIDLAGHTGVNRLEVFARRVAPVQITYLGYPNTTGVPAMDYRFTDPICDPSGEEPFHQERLVRFAPTAWTFRPPTEAPAVAKQTQENRVVLGCFNNFAKVSTQTGALWARILRRHPEAVLFLKAHDLASPEFQAEIHRRWAAHGIKPTQLRLESRSPSLAVHLEHYNQVDLALDPFPYHGTTTTCEALWMGTPVVTLRGDRHAARVSASLLHAVGHPEWIAEDESAYETIVTHLIASPDKRREHARQLRAEMAASRLLDFKTQAHAFWQAVEACSQEPI